MNPSYTNVTQFYDGISGNKIKELLGIPKEERIVELVVRDNLYELGSSNPIEQKIHIKTEKKITPPREL